MRVGNVDLVEKPGESSEELLNILTMHLIAYILYAWL